jgi:hypothetical protein
MERVKELLKGSFWKLDLSRVCLSKAEIDFLKVFFNVVLDQFIDDLTCEEKNFLILIKKEKFISNPIFN